MSQGKNVKGRQRAPGNPGGIFTSHRHAPFFTAMLLGILCLPVSIVLLPLLAIPVTASVFFVSYLFLVAIRLPRLTAVHLRAHAENDDVPALVIISATLLAVAVAVIFLFLALNSPVGKENAATGLPGLVMSFLSVILGWMTIHTMTALHYARLYWQPSGVTARGERGQPHRGLEFPGTENPCGYDFLYFSFIIGMTAQTSDTALTSTTMRKANLLHAVVSFFFNTVLVAAAVNAAVSLAA